MFFIRGERMENGGSLFSRLDNRKKDDHMSLKSLNWLKILRSKRFRAFQSFNQTFNIFMAQIIVYTVEFFHIKSKSLKIDCIHSIIVVQTFSVSKSLLLHSIQAAICFFSLTETVPNIFNNGFLIHYHVTIISR